jgi:hypothetical protein
MLAQTMLHTAIFVIVLWWGARLVVRALGALTAAAARAVGLTGDPQRHAHRWSALFRVLLAIACLAFAIPLGKLLWDAGLFVPFAELPGAVLVLAVRLWVALWQAAFGGP